MSIFGVPDDIIEDKFPNGSESAPAVAFLSDPDTGMYLESAGAVAISTNGTKRLRVNDAYTTVSNPLAISFGSNTDPGIGFTGEPNTGIYRVGAGNLGITCSGTRMIDFHASRVDVLGPIRAGGGTSSTPIYSFTGDPNTGVYRESEGVVGISANGTPATFSATGLSVIGGTGSAPGVSFTGDPNTGIYSDTADTLGLSAGGPQIVITTSTTEISNLLSLGRVYIRPVINSTSGTINSLSTARSLVVLTSNSSITLNGLGLTGTTPDGTIVRVLRTGFGSNLVINHVSGSASVGEQIICPGGVGSVTKTDRSISYFIYYSPFWYLQ